MDGSPKKLDSLKAQLREASARVDPGLRQSGVYALFDGDELVYIGQSRSVGWRIVQHMGDKQFDAAAFIKLPSEQLLAVEAMLIKAWKPRLNKALITLDMRRQQLGALEVSNRDPQAQRF